MAVKTQNQTSFFGVVQRSTYVGTILNSSTSTDCLQSDYSELISFSHPWHARKSKRFRGADLGGMFSVRSCKILSHPAQVNATNGPSASTWYKYTGYLHAYQGTKVAGKIDLISASIPSVLDGLGTTAINRVLPTKSMSDLGQFLGELHQLPTKFTLHKWKPESKKWLNGWLQAGRNASSAGKFSRRAANDWLNLQFGWLPFVSDILDTIETIRDKDDKIRKWLDNSGKPVHRSYAFDDEVSESDTVQVGGNQYGSPAPQTFLIQTPGKLYKSSRKTTKRWFRGSFTYYVPKQRLRRIESLANKMFGLRLDPELLWNLAPWSWALDWVGNYGDVIGNISAFTQDGLVMNYGYMMEHITVDTSYVLVGLALKGNASDVNPIQVVSQEVKSRRRATPYGFGKNPGSFSNRQWSIIAALGISKVPRSLNF